MANFIWDIDRVDRTGIAEAVFCERKSIEDLNAILEYHLERKQSVLLTRLHAEYWRQLSPCFKGTLTYNAESRTAVLNPKLEKSMTSGVGVVCAGTSDLPVALEAVETLKFNSFAAPLVTDVGVAGLWRLMEKIESIREFQIIIAVAGMEGALFSVLAGLVKAPIIALPSSVGYGVSAGGVAALNSALASCSPGILTVNIDNGYGAAISAIKIMNVGKGVNGS